MRKHTKLLKAAEYAVKKQVGVVTVYRWLRMGLPHVKQANPRGVLRPHVMLIDAEAADAWLEARAAAAVGRKQDTTAAKNRKELD